MPRMLSAIQVINESDQHVKIHAQFESGNVQVHTLKGEKDHVLIQRQDIEGSHKKDPVTKLVFKYKDKTEEKALDDIQDRDRITYRIDPDFNIKQEK